MKAGIAYIRKELTGIFAPEEIESLIFLIFEKLKGYSRTQFLLAKDIEISAKELDEIETIINRLKNHEPIQYILGQTEFYGLPFYTVPEVLIPRPETEELVQWIIQENQRPGLKILDIGTGTGSIAISLSKNIEQSAVFACDISSICLETASRNAAMNAADVTIFEYDILNGTPVRRFPEFDVIVSNPPYVRENEKALMKKNVLDFEPELALFVPDDNPLLFYERIADFSLVHLKRNGKVFFEINEAFGKECVEMMRLKGFANITLKKDINGKDRMIKAVKKQSTGSTRDSI